MFCRVGYPLFAFSILTTLSSVSIAQRASPLPEFRRQECETFRELLKEHSDLTECDRQHSTNLGIAGVVLFWIGIPGVPLGISAIVMGRRMDTKARRKLKLMEVYEDNYRRINELCSELLSREPLRNVTFRGKNGVAIALGGVALGLSLLVCVVLIGYFVIICCHSEGKGLDEDCFHDVRIDC